MGGRAYGTLAAARISGPRRIMCGVFGELARKFQGVVDAIGEISDTARVWGPNDVLRLYELWLKTGSQRAQGLLRRLGVAPIPASLQMNCWYVPVRSLQRLLETIYDAPSGHDVCDFLVTERRHLPAERRAHAAEEELVLVDQIDYVGGGANIPPILDGAGSLSSDFRIRCGTQGINRQHRESRP